MERWATEPSSAAQEGQPHKQAPVGEAEEGQPATRAVEGAEEEEASNPGRCSGSLRQPLQGMCADDLRCQAADVVLTSSKL